MVFVFELLGELHAFDSAQNYEHLGRKYPTNIMTYLIYLILLPKVQAVIRCYNQKGLQKAK